MSAGISWGGPFLICFISIIISCYIRKRKNLLESKSNYYLTLVYILQKKKGISKSKSKYYFRLLPHLEAGVLCISVNINYISKIFLYGLHNNFVSSTIIIIQLITLPSSLIL